MPRIVRIAFLLAILAAVSVPAGGAELLVSQDGSAGFRTITGAIDAAHYGDRIYVNPGVYEEHVYLKDGITLIGAGATVTRIRYGYGFEEGRGSPSSGNHPSLPGRWSSSIRPR